MIAELWYILKVGLSEWINDWHRTEGETYP